MLATPEAAHLEWHRNAGIPVGLSCPQDFCDPANLTDEEAARLIAIRDANWATQSEWENSEEAQALCEHQMSAWLCQGPNHYGYDYGDNDW